MVNFDIVVGKKKFLLDICDCPKLLDDGYGTSYIKFVIVQIFVMMDICNCPKLAVGCVYLLCTDGWPMACEIGLT